MENETKLSVAIIEPKLGLFRGIGAVKKQVAATAEANADVIIIHKYTDKADDVLEAYYNAVHFNPGVAVFSPTASPPNNLFSRLDGDLLSSLNYKVEDANSTGKKESNLDLLIKFYEGQIQLTQSDFDRTGEGGYSIMLDDNGNHAVYYKHHGSKTRHEFPVPGKPDKSIKNCTWYDLKF